MSFWPEDVESVGKFYLDGDVNGETYREAEFDYPLEPFQILHKPVYEGIEIPKELNLGVYDGSRDNPEYRETWNEWEDNWNADFYFYLENGEDEMLRFDLIPRTDTEFSGLEKPYSMMEAKHIPEPDSPYRETQKLVFRIARRFEDEVYMDRDIDPVGVIPEIDLLTAFDRKNGIQDLMRESKIEWRRPIRQHYQVIEDGYEPDWEKSTESVPLLMKFLPNDLASVGVSRQETRLAGLHIASAHGINLSFRDEREAEELMIEFGRRHENLVNIDAEFGRYTEGKTLDRDMELFKHQIRQLGGEAGWRERENAIKEIHEDTLEEIEKSERNWDEILPQNLPENWEEELPEERFVR